MNRLRLFILGALNGALYGAVMYVIVWKLRADAEARIVKVKVIATMTVRTYECWSSILLIWIVLFALVAVVAKRFWPREGSWILFWEAVGLVAVAVWNVFVMLDYSLQHTLFNSPVSYDLVKSSPVLGLSSLATVVVVNFVYSVVLLLFTNRRA